MQMIKYNRAQVILDPYEHGSNNRGFLARQERAVIGRIVLDPVGFQAHKRGSLTVVLSDPALAAESFADADRVRVPREFDLANDKHAMKVARVGLEYMANYLLEQHDLLGVPSEL